jgi:hypothetical protein
VAKASRGVKPQSRLGSRRLARLQRFGEDYSLELFVTFGLGIAGIFLGYSSLANSSKFSLAVLFAVFDIVFVFFRNIAKRIDDLANDYLTVIPRKKLSRVLYQHLDSQREGLLIRASRLAEHLSCELEKHEMYGELIGLTAIVTEYYAGSRDGTIWAISSVNIEDFDEEPLAEAYLEANRTAVAHKVDVRRIFLLDSRQMTDRRVRSIVERHSDALREGESDETLAVRWILRSELDRLDQIQDFALFATDALVIQSAAAGIAELTHDDVKIRRASDAFTRLWNHPRAHTVRELRDLRP